ncbi:MAG: hypothetical protein WCB68_21800 [Pyrinomonadaceae bacterium]
MQGCVACGAQAVGSPLPPPEHELPYFGRALFVGSLGAIVLLVFLTSAIAALFERAPFSLGFWSIVAAAETASWRLKWFALPLALHFIWIGWRMTASIRESPKRFAGLRLAHGGLAASMLAALMMLTFIGVTVPERLRRRERGIEAGYYAKGHTIDRAILEYRQLHQTVPSDLNDLKTLPDPSGSIAAALKDIDPKIYSIAYKPSADLASLPKGKPKTLRGAVLRNIAANDNTAAAPVEGIIFTNYEMRLPGEDKKLNTPDDWIIRDGVVIKP